MKDTLIKAKDECEQSIYEALTKFYKNTGFEPEDISFGSITRQPRREWAVLDVKLTFSYPS